MPSRTHTLSWVTDMALLIGRLSCSGERQNNNTNANPTFKIAPVCGRLGRRRVNAQGSLKKGIASPTPTLLNTDGAASAFQQDYVAPDATKYPEPFSPPYFPKAAAFVQRDADGILGEYSGLQGPDAVSFGFID